MTTATSGDDGIGLAIFVKTPGHSPLKTRLAAGIGRRAAEDFHRFAAEAVAAVVRAAQVPLPGLAACWAVAEESALDAAIWSGFPCIAQGTGDLGARMRRVTEHLFRSRGGALLLGADTPQLCVDDLVDAVHGLRDHDHVLGPSTDGGFWLFATRTHIPAAAWTHTPWSRPDTTERFATALGPRRIARLRDLRDADTIQDLRPLLAALDALPVPLPEQMRLAHWLRDLAL